MTLLLILWYTSLVGFAAVVGRMLWLGLAGRYRFFCLFLASEILRSIALTVIGPPTGVAYTNLWVATEPPMQLLAILMVLEVHTAICEHYPRIGRFARWLLIGAMAVAVLLCAATVLVDLNAMNWRRPILRAVYLSRRCVTSILVTFLVLIGAYFRRYPRPLKRNIVVHANALLVFFAVEACGYLAVNVWPQSSYWVGLSDQITGCICSISWLRLSRAGETAAHVPMASAEEVAAAKAHFYRLLGALKEI